MNKPHKHAEIIKAWADGHQIEYRYRYMSTIGNHTVWSNWTKLSSIYPNFITDDDWEFRIAPPKKTPGQVYYETVHGEEWSPLYQDVEKGAQAVIDAYKRGEFDEQPAK